VGSIDKNANRNRSREDKQKRRDAVDTPTLALKKRRAKSQGICLRIVHQSDSGTRSNSENCYAVEHILIGFNLQVPSMRVL
jgi:hypothetical protein